MPRSKLCSAYSTFEEPESFSEVSYSSHDQVAQSLEIERDLVRMQEDAQPSPVFVLDQAEIAETKCWPPRILLTLLGGVLGFLSVIGWILAAPYRTVHTSPPTWRTALLNFSNDLHRLHRPLQVPGEVSLHQSLRVILEDLKAPRSSVKPSRSPPTKPSLRTVGYRPHS